MEYLDENALREIMMKIENEDDLKSWYSINNKFKNIYKKYKEEWYGKYEPVEDVDTDGYKRETITIGNRKYVTTFFENGNTKEKEEYKDGKPEGKWTAWYSNGKKYYEVKHKDGKNEGKWITWWYNGNIHEEGEYKNGKKEGKWVGWYENGNRMNEREFKNDKKCGIWKKWNEDGRLVSQKKYSSCGKVGGKKVESISPRKKSPSKKAISQKKCASQGKMQNTITGGCRRKCKVGKEKIGSDGKCTKR